jgi:hypothetical protein
MHLNFVKLVNRLKTCSHFQYAKLAAPHTNFCFSYWGHIPNGDLEYLSKFSLMSNASTTLSNTVFYHTSIVIVHIIHIFPFLYLSPDICFNHLFYLLLFHRHLLVLNSQQNCIFTFPLKPQKQIGANDESVKKISPSTPETLCCILVYSNYKTRTKPNQI